MTQPDPAVGAELAGRIQGRLDRLGLSAAEASKAGGLPLDAIEKLLDGTGRPPRGKRLVQLADALSTSVSYLVGLDPDTPVPDEYLQEEQGNLGLLAGDEDALLRAYRRLDVSCRAALLQVVLKMAPEPEVLGKARQAGTSRGGA